jgi:glutamyl/glutaminyl-tRNA synthetase
MGYLSEALLNYLLLLSWAPGDNRELINLQEAIKLFDIKNVNKTAATFDLKKLDWINNQYLKIADPEKLADELIPLLEAKGYINKDNFDRLRLLSLVKLFQARLPRLNDFVEWADFFFVDHPVMDESAVKKYLASDLSKEFKLFAQRLDNLASFDAVNIETGFRELVLELGIEAKKLIHPIRVALTGKTIGPGLFEVIYYLGKEKSIKRLLKWVS